jgi:hypothetical protein
MGKPTSQRLTYPGLRRIPFRAAWRVVNCYWQYSAFCQLAAPPTGYYPSNAYVLLDHNGPVGVKRHYGEHSPYRRRLRRIHRSLVRRLTGRSWNSNSSGCRPSPTPRPASPSQSPPSSQCEAACSISPATQTPYIGGGTQATGRTAPPPTRSAHTGLTPRARPKQIRIGLSHPLGAIRATWASTAATMNQQPMTVTPRRRWPADLPL